MKIILYFLQYIFIKLFFLICKTIGFKKASNFGKFVGEKIGPIFKSKEIIKKNINLILPNTSQENIDIITKKMWGNYGRILSEYVFLEGFRKGSLEKYLNITGLEYLNEIKKKNIPVVFISGHFNNFELMAMQIEKVGVDCAAIYRPLNNPYLNSIMEKIRIRDICKNQIKKGRAGTRQIIRFMSKGTSIALMIDQRVREGEKINFFGSPATTTTIPAQLIKKYNCSVVPIYIERNKSHYFKMYVSKPIKISKSRSISEITKHLNNILEKMILKNIDQWIWTHDRWKV